jgi:hypothetical protein
MPDADNYSNDNRMSHYASSDGISYRQQKTSSELTHFLCPFSHPWATTVADGQEKRFAFVTPLENRTNPEEPEWVEP